MNDQQPTEENEIEYRERLKKLHVKLEKLLKDCENQTKTETQDQDQAQGQAQDQNQVQVQAQAQDLVLDEDQDQGPGQCQPQGQPQLQGQTQMQISDTKDYLSASNYSNMELFTHGLSSKGQTQDAITSSTGYFITTDSSFGNSLLPGLPRFEPEDKKNK